MPCRPEAIRMTSTGDGRFGFVPHPCFDDPAQHDQILDPMPELADGRASRRANVPVGLPPYLAALYEVPLLGHEQEIHLFRKMNFLKYLANQLRDEVDPGRADSTMLDRIEQLQEEALAVRNQIIRANLRLVVSIAKRHVGPTHDLVELVSDGNTSLIRAVERFDYARGNRFSTYASWAIMRNLAGDIRMERRRRERFVTGHGAMIEAAADRADEHEDDSALVEMQQTLAGLLGQLNDRERKIIVSRFGLGGTAGKTLEQLGKELGITKERVRQLDAGARDRLRTLAKAQTLDLLAADHSPRRAYFRPEPIWRGKPGVSGAGDRDTEIRTTGIVVKHNPGKPGCAAEFDPRHELNRNVAAKESYT